MVEHGDLDDAVDEPAQGGGQAGGPDRPVGRVGDHDHVGGEQVLVRGEERQERRRADLLLPLDEDRDTDTEVLAQHPQGADVRDDPGLVVGRAAPVQAAVALRGLERRALPVRVLPGRLDVVVRVEQDRRGAGGRGTSADDRGRTALDLEHLDVVETDAPQQRDDGVGAGGDVRLVELRVRDAGDPDEGLQIRAQVAEVVGGPEP